MITDKRLVVVKYFVLILVSIVSLFPLIWMVIAATNKSADVLTGTLLPGSYLIENLNTLLEKTTLLRSLWNSIRNSFIATIGCLIICSIAGYGFEIYHDKAKDILMKILLLSMMVPFAVTMIPLFMLFGKLNLMSTTTAFVLPMLSMAYIIFLFRQSNKSFPLEVIEAARMEGMGELRIFLSIYVPMMKPIYAAAGVMTFMNVWNDYLWSLVILQEEKSKTMPLLISNMTSGYVIDYGALMLAVTISVIPTLIVFLFLQKNFARGITSQI